MMTKLFSSVGPGQAAPTSRGSLTGGCCATHTVPPWKRISHKEGPTPLSSTSPRGSGRSCLFSSAPRSPVLLAPSSPESFPIPPQWIHAQLSPSSSVAMQNNHHKERLYKILVIGDLGVGKTSIIKRYVHHNFSPNYRATIGVDFALKVLNWEQETVRLQLWDIAGTDRQALQDWVWTQTQLSRLKTSNIWIYYFTWWPHLGDAFRWLYLDVFFIYMSSHFPYMYPIYLIDLYILGISYLKKTCFYLFIKSSNNSLYVGG